MYMIEFVANEGKNPYQRVYLKESSFNKAWSFFKNWNIHGEHMHGYKQEVIQGKIVWTFIRDSAEE